MSDDITHLTEPPTITPLEARERKDPIAEGNLNDPDANVRLRLLSGRTLNGVHVAEETHGITISIDGWEYTYPWSSIDYAVSLPAVAS